MRRINKTSKNALYKINHRKYNRAIFYCAAAFAVFLGNSLCAEPRATISTSASGILLEKMKLAAGEIESSPQSAFEARRRAETAATNVMELLKSEGYYQAVVTPEVPDEEPARAILRVEIGPRFIIANSQIEFEGDVPDPQTRGKVVSQIETANNKDARAEEIISTEGKALGAALSSGYADATTANRRVIVDHSTLKMNPIFKIRTGKLTKLGSIELIGKTKTKENWLKNIVPWQSGDNFAPDKINEFEKRLLETGVYDTVSILLGDTNEGNSQRPVKVSLSDRARTSIEAQFNYSTNEGPSIEGRIGRYNILGRGDTLFGTLLIGDIEKRLETELRLPHFIRPSQTLATSVAAFDDNTKAYRETGIEFKSELTKRWNLNSFWTYGVRTNISRNQEVSSLTQSNTIERDFATIGLVGSFLVDNTDRPLDPRAGHKFNGSIMPTIITGDANLSYLEVGAQASYYKTIGDTEDNILAARARIGSIIGGKIPELPAGRRLYAGGGGSVRGYEYQGIGPRYNDADRTPIGGLSLIEMSAEYRRNIGGKYGLVGFVDVGNLGLEAAPSFSNFRAAAGLGLRYDLGFAPLRLDVALPIKRQAGESGFQIYIGVGQSF